MSLHYHTAGDEPPRPPAARSSLETQPNYAAAWRQTLRFEDAPDILDAEEAAVLSRLGTTAAPIYEVIKEQDTQRAHGLRPTNPLRIIRRGKRILIPKQSLRQWLDREIGPEPDERLVL